MARLAEAGIPVGVLAAPCIPGLADDELDDILAAAREAGAASAGYVLLRLPLEVAEIFEAWLREHAPDRADRVMSLVRGAHGGRDYRSEFGHRMVGSGAYADMLGQRFRLTKRRLGYGPPPVLASGHFVRPAADAAQLSLL